MPELPTLIALFSLLGIAQFDRYSLDPRNGAATITWALRAPAPGAPPGPSAANLLVGLLSAIKPGTVVSSVAVNAAGVPFIAVTVPA